MRIIQTILLMSLSFLLLNCDKEDDKVYHLSVDSLKQTQWNGTLEETDDWGEGEYIAYIGLIFYSEKTGKCSVKRGDGPPFEYDFEYSIDGNILHISEGRGDLNGYWLLIQSDKDHMVLNKGTGGDGAYNGVLSLTKKY